MENKTLDHTFSNFDYIILDRPYKVVITRNTIDDPLFTLEIPQGRCEINTSNLESGTSFSNILSEHAINIMLFATEEGYFDDGLTIGDMIFVNGEYVDMIMDVFSDSAPPTIH